MEIGYPWHSASAMRTGITTESTLLMLQHAFEIGDCVAVEFRTHGLKRQSRTAIDRLGARQVGILCSHRRTPDGSLRDTVVWPVRLRRRLAAHRPTDAPPDAHRSPSG